MRFFTNGVSHVAMNDVWGETEGLDFIEFDYRWGNILDELTITVPETLGASCAVTSLPARCPELMFSHETVAHWLEHPLHHEIFTSEREDFAKAFRITTSDRSFAAAVFDEAMESWFLQNLRGTNLCFEISDSWLMCFTAQLEPADLMPLIRTLKAFHDRIPEAALEAYPPPE